MAEVISVLLTVFLSWSALPARADEAQVTPGLITAPNVDVTTDTGELLDQRLTTGDKVFIINKVKQKKQGWVRISRSATDQEGIGWVESKYVQAFDVWEGGGGPANTRPATGAPQPSAVVSEPTRFGVEAEGLRYNKIGVLPFAAPGPNDAMAKSAYDAFALSLRKSGRVTVVTDVLKNDRFNPEKADTIQKVIKARKLDGVFVGNLSAEMGSSRLLQVKFYGMGKNEAVLEKVKKLPKAGNLQEIMTELVSSCLDALASQ
jgi:hypothetical protein